MLDAKNGYLLGLYSNLTAEAVVESFEHIGDGVQSIAFELIADVEKRGRMFAGIPGGQQPNIRANPSRAAVSISKM